RLADVELVAIAAQLEGGAERLQRVLVGVLRGAAVADHVRALAPPSDALVPALGLLWSLRRDRWPVNGELLHPLVRGVHNVQVALAVDGQPVRELELPLLVTLLPERQQVLPLRREELHPVVRRADPDPALAIDADAHGAGQWIGFLLLSAAEAARPAAVVTPGQERLTVRSQLLHATLGPLGGVQVPLRVERQEVR